jgi:hypothetical protein
MPTPKPALSHAILLSTTFDIPTAIVLHLIPGTSSCFVCCCELNHKQVSEVKSSSLVSYHVWLHGTLVSLGWGSNHVCLDKRLV